MMKLLLSIVLLQAGVFLVSALTSDEYSKFKARTHIEKNTNMQGAISVTDKGNGYHLFVSNGIPDHDTGTFPAVFNPNDITVQNYQYTIKDSPTKASSPSCVPAIVGLAINGVQILNPYTIDICDAVNGEFKETFDSCGGHPAPGGQYHYHGKPNCLFTNDSMWSEPDVLLGVALDGYPIYGPVDSNNKVVTSADLDECHGREENGQYRYRFTTTFPYYLACFRGEYNYESVTGRRQRPDDPLCRVITDWDDSNKHCTKTNGVEALHSGVTSFLVIFTTLAITKLSL